MSNLVEWHTKGSKKSSGGFRSSARRSDKKLAWKGGTAALTKIGEQKNKSVDGRGNSEKTKLFQTRVASIVEPKSRKTVKAEILAVSENPANRQFTKQNVITKGAKIKVRIDGKEAIAVVTSRPGQHGIVQAVLVE